MAGRRNLPPPRQPAHLSPVEMQGAIIKLERRIAELNALDVTQITNGDDPLIKKLENKIQSTVAEIFGTDSLEYDQLSRAWHLDRTSYRMVIDIGFGPGGGTSAQEIREGVDEGRKNALALLEAAADNLREKVGDLGLGGGNAIRAFAHLDLHKEIERAAGQLFRDGHYADAVLRAAIRLNDYVKYRSKRSDLDGTNLMEAAFSLKSPILKFNDLADESQRNEQTGFKYFLMGVVAALRHPRAHSFKTDDAERALKFLAIISLLAELVDEAKDA